MKQRFVSLFLLLIPAIGLQAEDHNVWLDRQVELIYNTVDDEVEARLSSLDQSIVEHRNDEVVRRIIRMYVERWRSGSEVILGRTARYFPRFEAELEKRGMPDAIKYLSITESALRPWAVSRVGAAGLWQLMPGTAIELGLRVDSIVDERLDFQLGTEAGLEYLQIQYERYEDWALALAAYNSGPGRVNRAMRRSGSKDFWRMQRHLPRETRAYVPGYIAAVYLAAFFHEHQLEPHQTKLDLVLHEGVAVSGFHSMHRVAQVTGLRPAEVLELNPAYLMGYVPDDGKTHFVYLPRRVVPAFNQYLQELGDVLEEDFQLPWLSPRFEVNELESEQYYQLYSYYVMSYDTSLAQVADLLQTPAVQLQVWNYSGSMDSLREGRYLDYYRVREYLEFGPPQPPVYEPWPVLASRPAKVLIKELEPPQAPLLIDRRSGNEVKARRGLFRQIGSLFERRD